MESEKMQSAAGLNPSIIESAIESPKAVYQDGKCSICGMETHAGNFCEGCGATFVTKKQIEHWREANPSAAKAIDSRLAQKAKIFKI